MTRTKSKGKRILAIDPTTRGFGWVVFEGPERIIDWQVARVRPNSTTRILQKIATLLDRYEPDVAVIEDFSVASFRRAGRIRRLLEALVKLLADRKTRVCTYSQKQIRKTFDTSGKITKYEIACQIAVLCPELHRRLPPPRKPWKSEDERMSLFDAAALALTYFRLEGRWSLNTRVSQP